LGKQSRDTGFFWGKAGASLIETLVAFLIFSVSLVALYPILFQIKTANRGTDVRKLCDQTVRAKLSEYQSGRSIPSSELSRHPQLTGIQSLAGGTALDGFGYSKLRYNSLYQEGVCDGRATVELIRSAPITEQQKTELSDLGIRECLSASDPSRPPPVLATCSTGVKTCKNLKTGIFDARCACSTATEEPTLNDAFRTSTCDSELDKKVQAQSPGFKLYVKLERASPWKMDLEGLSELQELDDFRFHPHCPNSRSGPFTGELNLDPVVGDHSIYDFESLGDAIRVTVTGVMDITSVQSGLSQWLGIPTTDPSRFMCSVSSVITQSDMPIRYSLISSEFRSLRDGFLGGGSLTSGRKVLSEIESLSQGIKAFAVHPLNSSVYLLGAGRITRFAKCGGIPFDCLSNSRDATALIDDLGRKISGTEGLTSQSYQTPLGNSFQHLLFDFRSTSTAGDGSVVDSPEVYVGTQGLCSLSRVVLKTDGTFVVEPVDATAAVGSRVIQVFGGYLNSAECAGTTGVNVGQLTGAVFDPSGGYGLIQSPGQEGEILYRAEDLARSAPIVRFPFSIRAVSR